MRSGNRKSPYGCVVCVCGVCVEAGEYISFRVFWRIIDCAIENAENVLC